MCPRDVSNVCILNGDGTFSKGAKISIRGEYKKILFLLHISTDIHSNKQINSKSMTLKFYWGGKIRKKVFKKSL